MTNQQPDSTLTAIAAHDYGAFLAAATPSDLATAAHGLPRLLRAAARLLNPGDFARDLIGAERPDDRMVLRMFVSLGVYSKIAALIALFIVA